MLEVTVKEIFSALPILNIIAQFADMGKLPFVPVQKIKSFADNGSIISDVNRERIKIYKKFCKESEEKTELKFNDKFYIIIDKEKYEKYTNLLNNYKVDLVNFTPFTNDDLKDISGINQTAIELLGRFLENNSDKQKQKIEIKFEDENENI